VDRQTITHTHHDNSAVRPFPPTIPQGIAGAVPAGALRSTDETRPRPGHAPCPQSMSRELKKAPRKRQTRKASCQQTESAGTQGFRSSTFCTLSADQRTWRTPQEQTTNPPGGADADLDAFMESSSCPARPPTGGQAMSRHRPDPLRESPCDDTAIRYPFR